MKQLDNRGGAALGIGEYLDHYRIDRVVSKGRAADTFQATDVLTNRQVAIEIPHVDVEADPVLSDRFQREEEISKNLDHPGLIRLIERHGAGYGGGQSYLVREWYEGSSLRELLSKGKLAPERAIKITASICDITEYIHSHGIVLRDIEPEHILVGENDEVKLIHIGVTSALGARRLTFTKLSQVVGTSQYISPEELKGQGGDARSDIYSIGVMLYEMVTGHLPFPEEKFEARLLSYPVPPREIDPKIPPQLQEVIYRAMERQPQNRYASAREFARDLRNLDQVGVADRPEIRDWRKQSAPPIKKFALYAALILIPVAILGLLLYFAKH